MNYQATETNLSGKLLVVTGFIAILSLFIIYSRFQDSEMMTPDAIRPMVQFANSFYVILLIAFGAIALGLYKYHKTKITEDTVGLLKIIAITTWNKKSRRIFVITFIAYGLFFSLASGTLVYQPQVTFSIHYNAKIPSGFIAPCCDAPGYMPKIIVYLTEHVGLQIIPINLVLQIIVSYLVGLNTAMAISAISISRKGRGMSTIGAATGLFIACPTCAGSFLSIFIGTASGIALTIALTQLQTLFIAISIPVLLVTPFILARKLRNADGSCAINPS